MMVEPPPTRKSGRPTKPSFRMADPDNVDGVNPNGVQLEHAASSVPVADISKVVAQPEDPIYIMALGKPHHSSSKLHPLSGVLQFSIR
jgi:hypothetical protein